MNYAQLSKQELIKLLKEKDKKIKRLDNTLNACKNINLYRKQFINQTELQLIIEKTPVGFCITDQDGYFELVNPAYCDIYGYTEEELKQANQKLLEKANTDSLTGLYNHKEIMRRLKLESKRATRYDLDLTIMMLDIDDFKVVNDTYGHPKGDQILKSIADILEKITRKEDFVGRYGGEEFLIVFPHTKLVVVKEADQNLYSAKNSGKNKICC